VSLSKILKIKAKARQILMRMN